MSQHHAASAGFGKVNLSYLFHSLVCLAVMFSYCSNNGTNPVPAVVMVVMSVHLAFLTPAASSSAALLHGNEWTTGRDILKTAPAIMAFSWLIMCASVLTLSAVFF